MSQISAGSLVAALWTIAMLYVANLDKKDNKSKRRWEVRQGGSRSKSRYKDTGTRFKASKDNECSGGTAKTSDKRGSILCTGIGYSLDEASVEGQLSPAALVCSRFASLCQTSTGTAQQLACLHEALIAPLFQAREASLLTSDPGVGFLYAVVSMSFAPVCHHQDEQICSRDHARANQ